MPQNDTQTIISNEEVNELKKIQENLDNELNLHVPEDTITEFIPLWYGLFSAIRKLYQQKIINKVQVIEILSDFYEIPDGKKQEFLNELLDLVDETIDDLDFARQMIVYKEVEQKVQTILELLTPELRIELIKELNNGKIPEKLQKELAARQQAEITPEEAELYAKYRLSKALDEKNTLDLRKLDFNKPLTKDDVAAFIGDNVQNGPTRQQPQRYNPEQNNYQPIQNFPPQAPTNNFNQQFIPHNQPPMAQNYYPQQFNNPLPPQFQPQNIQRPRAIGPRSNNLQNQRMDSLGNNQNKHVHDLDELLHHHDIDDN